MKKILLIAIIGASLISCSSSKNTIASKTTSPEPKKTNFVTSNNISNKINVIIQHSLGIPLTSIARSEITQTRTGYHWKFMNVRTGEKFIGNTDLNFQSVDIRKYKKG